MDEATSAIDEPAERTLYERLNELLPHTAIVSVGHRSSLLAFHDVRLVLDGGGPWQREEIPAALRDGGDGKGRRGSAVEINIAPSQS